MMSLSPVWILLASLSATPSAEPASSDVYTRLFDKEENFGAVLAPASLPSGASSMYLSVGAPDLSAGYRLGISGLELDARVKVDYFRLSLALEAVGKGSVYTSSKLQVAPFLGLGFVLNSGARYFDNTNVRMLALRVLGGVTASYRLGDLWRGIAQVDIPVDFGLSPGGAGGYASLWGGGAEFYLGEDFSALLLGQLGWALAKEPLGVPVTKVAYAIRLGVGVRLH